MSRRILVVDDDPNVCVTFEFHLRRSDFEVRSVQSAEAGLQVLHEFDPDVVLTDIQLPGMSGLDLLKKLHSAEVDADVIVITGYEDMRSAVGAIRDGAYDYIVKPVDLDQLDVTLQRCYRDRAARQRSSGGSEEHALSDGEALVGSSPEMIEVYKTIGRLAETRAPVLIRGETGTGKERVARAIHYNSSHAEEPFVAINCTAVPESLLESELFGHLRGSFTGAVGDRKGRFELAGSGTIFLDEIGDTDPALQAKLLRVLQEREFYPVGSERPRRTSARVIAATHRPIEKLIADGKFREDLYFRLRVVEITVPPLRERRSDIPVLAQHLLGKVARELHKPVTVLPPDVLRRLQSYDWPGNVRELENALSRAVVRANGPSLSADHLSLGTGWHPDLHSAGEPIQTLDDAERVHVQRMLDETGGNKRQTARLLGISRPRLDRIIDKHALNVAKS